MADKAAKQVVKKLKIKKTRLPKKVQKWTSHIYTVQGVGPSEQVVVIQFGRNPKRKYGVVKLDVGNLPKQINGKPITWINNFAIVDNRGNYVQKVKYTLFLPPPPANKKVKFIYYADGQLNLGKTPTHKGSKPEQPGFLQVDFTTGDPGPGWT